MDPSGSRADAPVRIRSAKPDDAETLERIELATFDGDRLSRRSLRHHLVSPTADVMIAEIGREPAGYAMMFYRRGTRIGRLYSISTLPQARGRGVARALMAACERAARRRDCSVLRLEVREDNAAAIRLYESLGYVAFGRYETYYDDGASALRFDKPLRGPLAARSPALPNGRPTGAPTKTRAA